MKQWNDKNPLLMKGRREVRAGCLCQQRNEEGESVFFIFTFFYLSTEPGKVLNIQHEEGKKNRRHFPKESEKILHCSDGVHNPLYRNNVIATLCL